MGKCFVFELSACAPRTVLNDSIEMAVAVEGACDGCSATYFDGIKHYHKDDSASLKCFIAHGVIWSTKESEIPNCPNCDKKLSFDENRNAFRCYHSYVDKKYKRPSPIPAIEGEYDDESEDEGESQ